MKIWKFLTLFLVLLFSFKLVSANESEAFVFRIIPNEGRLSVSNWYKQQSISGSPQNLYIDGYEAIRNGRTVYVNVANVVKNSDGTKNIYTNIFIISYTQDYSSGSLDVFGQLLKNLKFNTNIDERGSCSVNEKEKCLIDSDCSLGQYCKSEKAKVIRDVRRLENLTEIQVKLNEYRSNQGFYPKLENGSYMKNISLSVWPSWEKTLSSDISLNLPEDPINKIGDCPGFDPITCWSEENKTFASNINNYLLPKDSLVYFYSTNDNGSNVKVCAQLENNYSNINVNCFDGNVYNSRPEIKAVNLSVKPKSEFWGGVMISDNDGDKLTLRAELESPKDATAWLGGGWKFVDGRNLQVISGNNDNHKTLYAPLSGLYPKEDNYYKIKLTVDDGRGASNSIYSAIYPIEIGLGEAYLNDLTGNGLIDKEETISMTGFDASGQEINKIYFESASYNDQNISLSELNKMGFYLDGKSLTKKKSSSQKTGIYKINVYAIVTESGKRVKASISYRVYNNPPILESIQAKFINNTSQFCYKASGCSFAIDSGENASIEIRSKESDGHGVSYTLLDNYGGKLIINSSAGVIYGFNKFISSNGEAQNLTVKVLSKDFYCNLSQPEECSQEISFNVLIQPVCSADKESSQEKITIPGPFTVTKDNSYFETGATIENCSQVISGRFDLEIIGGTEEVNNDQEIIIIADTSLSMKTNVNVNGSNMPAVTHLNNTLVGTDGVLQQLLKIAEERKGSSVMKVGIIAYNGKVASQPLIPLNNINIDKLVSFVTYNFSIREETDTLSALNKAEELFTKEGSNPDKTDRIIILMSDGAPLVKRYYMSNCRCIPKECSCWADPWPNCRDYWEIEQTKDQIDSEKRGENASVYWNSCGTLHYYCACQEDVHEVGVGCPDRYADGAKTCNYGQYLDTQCNVCRPMTCDYWGVWPNCGFPGTGRLEKNWQNIIKDTFSLLPAQAITNRSSCQDSGCDIYEIKRKTDNEAYASFIPGSCDTSSHNPLGWKSEENNCSIKNDVSTQATFLKNSGIQLYTVYYNTNDDKKPISDMCSWSSNNGINCDKNEYAFSGQDIKKMADNVVNNIKNYKPKNISINGLNITDPNPDKILSKINNFTFSSGFFCGAIRPKVNFVSTGTIKMSNLTLNYCPKKLHQ